MWILLLTGFRNIEYLVVNDDGTAYFDLNGERTEYTFDKKNFYQSDDSEKVYEYIEGYF